MEKKNRLIALLIMLGLVVVVLIVILIFTMNKSSEQSKQIEATEQFFEEEKTHMKSEVDDIAGEMDGYTVYIHNDSLLREFETQKQQIKNLQKELKNTKATDAKRILELKNEIASLRKILKHYIRQIDSLNVQNERLTSENVQVKRKYETVAATAEQLEQEKESLNEVVSRAAVLEIYNFRFLPLDKRNRNTAKAHKMVNLEFDFTVGKNITAEPGMKTIYLRIMRPDGAVMTKNSDQTFQYENRDIKYSLSKEIEYTGEAHSDKLYWNVEEILQLGSYQADFFIDGNRIGTYSFKIEKK